MWLLWNHSSSWYLLQGSAPELLLLPPQLFDQNKLTSPRPDGANALGVSSKATRSGCPTLILLHTKCFLFYDTGSDAFDHVS